ARLGQEFADGIAELGDHHRESELAAAATLLFVDRFDARTALEPRAGRRRRAVKDVLLLDVHSAHRVELHLGPKVGAVGELLPKENRGEECRGRDLRLAAEVAGMGSARGEREFTDLAVLDEQLELRSLGSDRRKIGHRYLRLLTRAGCLPIRSRPSCKRRSRWREKPSRWRSPTARRRGRTLHAA